MSLEENRNKSLEVARKLETASDNVEVVDDYCLDVEGKPKHYVEVELMREHPAEITVHNRKMDELLNIAVKRNTTNLVLTFCYELDGEEYEV